MISRAGALDAAFWRGRRVLVTGHSGFKGSWLSLMLADAGATVTGLSMPPTTAPSLFSLLDLSAKVDSRFGDLREPAIANAVVAEAEPEIVFHLAAQALVRESYRAPVETYATNVMGTVHLLEALRDCTSVRSVVVATTDKCYRNDESGRAYVEGDPLGGDDPYSSSKAAVEHVCQAYRASFAVANGHLATARAGNVIGGGDWSAERLVPDIVRAAMAEVSPVLRYPSSVRPWQHVLEALAGYLALARSMIESERGGGAWNFGPNESGVLTVSDVAEGLLRALGRLEKWELDSAAQPHEAKTLRLNSAKARGSLGWKNKLDERETIQWTADWYSAWLGGSDVVAVTRRQIEDYAKR